MANERKSELAKQIEARKLPLHEFAAEKFMGINGKVVGGVKVRAPLKADEIAARSDADAWVRETHKHADDDLKLDARTVFLLHRLTRDFDDPGNFPAFPTPAWMMANMQNDEIEGLLRLVASVKRADSPLEKDLSDELIDAYVAKAADHYGSTIASEVFSNCDRAWLEDFAIVVCKRLHDLTNPPEPENDDEEPEFDPDPLPEAA